MADPQDALRKWISDKLAERGPRSSTELAEHLGVSTDTITRMKNRDANLRTRRIEAHWIPKFVSFFNDWPPGFEPMTTDISDDDTPASKKIRSRQKQNTKKDVLIEGAEGPITLIDRSIQVLGDDAHITGTADTPPTGSGELMGQIVVALDAIYREMKLPLSLEDMGRIGIERFYSIVAACQTPEEYPHALEIMKLRVRRELDPPSNTPD